MKGKLARVCSLLFFVFYRLDGALPLFSCMYYRCLFLQLFNGSDGCCKLICQATKTCPSSEKADQRRNLFLAENAQIVFGSPLFLKGICAFGVKAHQYFLCVRLLMEPNKSE